MTTTIKHPQFILAMDNNFFLSRPEFKDGITAFPRERFIEEAQSHLTIRQRNVLETETQYRQLLPYVIIRQTGTDGVIRYLPYRRTSLVGEAKLAGKISVGYGGHIDLVDVDFNNKSVINLQKTLIGSAMREMDEELLIEVNGEVLENNFAYHHFGNIGFADLANHYIADSTNNVNIYHVAIICVFDAPADWKITCKEIELETMQPMTAEEILSSDLEIESWTKLYLEHVSNHPKSIVGITNEAGVV